MSWPTQHRLQQSSFELHSRPFALQSNSSQPAVNQTAENNAARATATMIVFAFICTSVSARPGRPERIRCPRSPLSVIPTPCTHNQPTGLNWLRGDQGNVRYDVHESHATFRGPSVREFLPTRSSWAAREHVGPAPTLQKGASSCQGSNNLFASSVGRVMAVLRLEIVQCFTTFRAPCDTWIGS